jgi:cytochrome c-type biogenesis protein CcmH
VRAALLALLLLAAPARAVLPDEMLADPALETRARAISQQLRCVVCQNETIDDSDAQIARDLRLLVRERLKAGDSDQQAMDFVVARYGHFVLMKPPVERSTWLLWAGPFAVLGLGGAALALWLRRRGALAEDSAALPLSDSEAEALSDMLDRTA